MKKSIHSSQNDVLRSFLIQMRKKKGLSQRDLADKVQREHSFIARIELGERRLDLIEFWRYCNSCDVDPVKSCQEVMKRFNDVEKSPVAGPGIRRSYPAAL